MGELHNDITEKLRAMLALNKESILTINQVADYYEVSAKTIKTIIERSLDEFIDDGMITLQKQDYISFLKEHKFEITNENEINYTILLTKKSFIRIGMLINGCHVAKMSRNYILNIEEIIPQKTKNDIIQSEVQRIIDNRLNTAVSKYVSKSDKFQYKEFNKLIYLFSNRDSELREEIEHIIIGLLSVGYSYEQIKALLAKKYKET